MNFLNSSILDVLLGLVFIYFLVSIICSSINEFLAGLLKWRARDLERGIVNLIREPDIVNQVLNHPMILALSTRNSEASLIKIFAGERNPDKVYLNNTAAEGRAQDEKGIIKNYAVKPSYIPARTFVLALLDTLFNEKPLSTGDIRNNAQDFVARARNNEERALGKILLLLLDDSQRSMQLVITVEGVRQVVEALPDTPQKAEILAIISQAGSLEAVRGAVLRLDVSNERKAVLDFLALGLSEIESFKKSVESWYDSAMDRVAGVYKRRVQIYLFFIGLIVAFIVGADSIYLANTLSSNPAVRQSLLADVSHATTPGGDFYFNPNGNGSGTVTSTISSTVAVSSSGNMTTTTTTVSIPSTQSVIDELQRFSELFGYESFGHAWDRSDLGQRILLVLSKILGVVITAFAVSFGAPFWFDLLNKIVNLRAAVKPKVGTS